jgi:serine/threonine protein kinase
LSITQSIEIILEVLDSLQYLHEHGIIHRDLNSDVVIIANKGPAKITSLGFTRVEDASSVSSGEFLGVVQYTAPEQITQSKSDSKSDIYSVGILLFEMLTGSPPFDSPLPVEVMDMHLKKMPRFPEESQKEIPLNLQRIVLKALSKSPDQRFQTAKDMAAELRNFLTAYKNGDDKSFDISTSPSEDASSLIYKNLPNAASVKSDSLSFSLKKKQESSKEKEMQKKVDVDKMMSDGLRDINIGKQKQKAAKGFTPTFSTEIKENKKENKKDNKRDKAGNLEDSLEPQNESSSLTPLSVLPSQKQPGGISRLFYYIMAIVAIGALLFGIFSYKPGSTGTGNVKVPADIEIISPKGPYELESFTPYPIKVKYPLGKDIQKLTITSFANEIQSTIVSMKDGTAEMQIYASVARINFKFPFDIVALNSKGKEISRTTFQGMLKNQKMVEVIIKPTEGIIEKRDAKEISPTTTKLMPIVYQFNLYVPIKDIIAMFNGNSVYDFKEEMLTITNMDSHTYKLFIFKNKYYIDNILYEGENPVNRALNDIDDHAYLPLYFLTEKMGFVMRIEQGISDNLEIHMIRAK